MKAPASARTSSANTPQKNRTRTTPLLAVAIAAALLLGVMCAVVASNKAITESTFEHALVESANTFATSQASIVAAHMEDERAILKTLSLLSPDHQSEATMETYLARLNATSEKTRYYFTSLEELENDPTIDQDWLESFKNTAYASPETLFAFAEENGRGFVAGNAVLHDNNLCGVLWAMVSAEKLLTADATHSPLYKIESTFLVDEEGTVLSMNGQHTPSAQQIEQFNAIERHSTRAITQATGEVDGNSHYLTSVPLGIQGWSLGFLLEEQQSDAIANQVFSISLKSITVTCCALVAFTAFVIYTVRTQRAKASIAEERYRLLEYFSDAVLFEYNTAADELRFTPNAADMLDIEDPVLEHFLAKTGERVVHPEDFETVQHALTGTLGDNRLEIQIRMRISKSAPYRWMLAHFRYVRNNSGIVSVVGRLTDFHEQQCRIDEAMNMASHDGATGIYNKVATEYLIKRCLEADHAPGVLFMIDLDNLKIINDKYGHARGDAELKSVADTLTAIFRSTDIIGRVGGDEFMVYMRSDASEDTMHDVIDRFSSTMRRMHDGEAPSVSIGAARASTQGETFEKLYAAADEQLYLAKKAGKGRLFFEGVSHGGNNLIP